MVGVYHVDTSALHGRNLQVGVCNIPATRVRLDVRTNTCTERLQVIQWFIDQRRPDDHSGVPSVDNLPQPASHQPALTGHTEIAMSLSRSFGSFQGSGRATGRHDEWRKFMPAPAKESALVSIRCSAELNELLDIASNMRGESKSDLIRELLIDGLKRLAEPEEVDRLLAEKERELAAQRAWATKASDQMRSSPLLTNN